MIATMMVLCDTQNSRREEERKNKKEQEEQGKLSIMPCLQLREKMIVNREQVKSDNNVYFVSYENGEIKQRRNVSRELERIFSDFCIMEAEIRNVGLGSTISLDASIRWKAIFVY